ncbi:MAG: CBS domain-containing protein [Aquisalimonadaceae bacterium]
MESTLHSILQDKHEALYTVSPDAKVQEAVNVMTESSVGCVLIMNHGRLEGVFTERDLMCRVVYAGRDPHRTPIREVMTTEIATVSPGITVAEAMTLCTQKRLRHLPVYEDDTLLGIVSAGDLTKWGVRDQQHTIEDLIKYIYGERA